MSNKFSEIHFIQKEILKKLAFSAGGLRFKDLALSNLNSDLLNYHIKTLVKSKFISKTDSNYSLTDLGKEYVNTLNKASLFAQAMAQTCVIIHGIRINDKNELEHLLCRRLVQPYFGKVSRITGKIQYGEDFESAAKRKLLEKTGLQAKNFVLERIYHKIGTDKNGNVLQDVIFYIFFVTDFFGELITKTETQENFWATSKQLIEDPTKYDRFQDMSVDDRRTPGKGIKVNEVKLITEGF